MWIFILVAVIAVLLILYIKFYNRLRRLSVKVQEGSAGIDVALEKRYDMLSEEIEAVKKYLAHEYQIYTTKAYFRKRNNCLRKRSKQSARRLPNSKSRWKQSDSSWISSEGKITLLERKHRVWEATG